MPVIGKDITPSEAQKLYPGAYSMLKPVTVVHPIEVKDEMPFEESKLIPAWLIHSSRILEPEFSKEVMESSRRDGIRVPIRVRPCHCEFLPIPHYEIVDGNSRHAGIITNKELRCIVVELTNEEVLLEMYILETKGHKSAFWTAQCIGKLVEMKEKELKDKGIDKGAKKEVAKKINKDNIASGQVIVSQYFSIYKLFNYLKTLKSLSENDLIQIKSLDKQNLLLLAYLDRSLLPEALKRWKENPSKPIIEIKRDIIGHHPSDERSKPKRPRKEHFIEPRPDILDFGIPPDLTGRIRRIMFWIEETLRKELKETKGFHWTKRDKILTRFIEKGKQTMLEIAEECLVMGIEDIEQATKEGSITLNFECVEGVPIGYKGIFKERMR